MEIHRQKRIGKYLVILRRYANKISEAEVKVYLISANERREIQRTYRIRSDHALKLYKSLKSIKNIIQFQDVRMVR